MFNYLANEYIDFFTYFNLFNYITFRTGASILTSLFFSLIFGEIIIKKLSTFQPMGQPIRKDGPENHIIKKAGTPTMGGILILASMTLSLFLWADLSNKFIWICFISAFLFGMIGFIDDYQKIKYNSHKGISGLIKISFQVLFSFIIVYLIQQLIPSHLSSTVHFPFF